MATPRKPRVPRENVQRLYYSVYASQGPRRSLRGTAEILRAAGTPVSPATLERYSSEFGWQELARQFDIEQADRQAAAVLESAITQDAQQMQLGRALQQMAAIGIQDYLRAAVRKSLGGTEIAGLAREGVRIERLASGRVTEITEVMVNLKAVIITGIGDGFLAALEVMDARLAGTIEPEALEELRNDMARTYGLAVDRLLTNEFRRVGIVDSEFVEPEE